MSWPRKNASACWGSTSAAWMVSASRNTRAAVASASAYSTNVTPTRANRVNKDSTTIRMTARRSWVFWYRIAVLLFCVFAAIFSLPHQGGGRIPLHRLHNRHLTRLTRLKVPNPNRHLDCQYDRPGAGHRDRLPRGVADRVYVSQGVRGPEGDRNAGCPRRIPLGIIVYAIAVITPGIENHTCWSRNGGRVSEIRCERWIEQCYEWVRGIRRLYTHWIQRQHADIEGNHIVQYDV